MKWYADNWAGWTGSQVVTPASAIRRMRSSRTLKHLEPEALFQPQEGIHMSAGELLLSEGIPWFTSAAKLH